MDWQEFTALLVLATAMSFSPGPNTTLSTALAANGGLPRAMRFVLAVPLGWTLLLALCAAGLGSLLVAAPDEVRAYAEKFSWRASAEQFVENLQPYPEPERGRFWRRLRRIARIRKRAAAA